MLPAVVKLCRAGKVSGETTPARQHFAFCSQRNAAAAELHSEINR
jgi:hypothetical protein